MKALHSFVALVLFAAVGLATDNLPRQIDVVKSMLSAMDKMTDTLKSISDEEAAKTARPELKKQAEEWIAMRKRAEKVPPPTAEEKELLVNEYQAKMRDAQKKLYKEIARVRDTVPGGREALTEFNSAFKTPEKTPEKKGSP
jgi:hypothetical protein